MTPNRGSRYILPQITAGYIQAILGLRYLGAYRMQLSKGEEMQIRKLKFESNGQAHRHYFNSELALFRRYKQ